ncbi:hypothetical protein [Phreatobacter stygius]|uniref:Glycosyltransferase RgtA/B/C/D-like domain-containing protein n=1 Tax=Phreatobacter stygius TaxID=1940610 RepID=A0A4D7B847_9HYPH|nr:hypothetical protein [Phreatobacter stygius]QCI64292.1 hypothetical protein E8M01_08580 [Phreatobacter stygius]
MTAIDSRSADLVSVYRMIVLINLLAFAVVVAHRCVTPLPDSEYVHRLVTYEQGLIRRGLIGEIYSWFTHLVSPWAVRIEGFLAIAVAGTLFAAIFVRTYRLKFPEALVLGCFLFGSPLLFKNFVGNLGKFDVLGAIVAMLAVLLPLTRWTYVAIGALSALLLFIHHVHATIYIPTIYGILLVRALGRHGRFRPVDLAMIAGSLALLAGLFGYLLACTAAKIPAETFLDSLRDRAMQPVPDRQAFMWYSSIDEEIRISLGMFPEHLKRLPIYAAIVLIHVPVIAFFARRIASLRTTQPLAYRSYLAVAAIVLGGFLVTNIITFDYARHLGNLALCFILLSQAQIVATSGQVTAADDLDPGNKKVIAAAVIAAALPWVGVVYPLI